MEIYSLLTRKSLSHRLRSRCWKSKIDVQVLVTMASRISHTTAAMIPQPWPAAGVAFSGTLICANAFRRPLSVYKEAINFDGPHRSENS